MKRISFPKGNGIGCKPLHTLLDKGTRLFDHISQGSVTLESNEAIESYSC